MATPEEHRNRELERYKREIRDAQLLLGFALEQASAIRDTPIVVSDTLVMAIKEAEDQLTATELPAKEIRTRFELAYRDLAQLVAPVTARTLRDTSDKGGKRGWYVWYFLGRSEYSVASLWSQHLWMITILVLLAVILTETLDRTLIQVPLDEESAAPWQNLAIISLVLNSLSRFGYGALGACAYLLRSLHVYTYRREFNRDRVPEYFNRILLGLVSGGFISLFVSQVTTDDGAVTLSEAALAFLAGYNTDFLFRALERVAEAILPKVGIETVRRAPPVPVTAPVSLEDLLNRLAAATSDDDKALLRELINKVKERM